MKKRAVSMLIAAALAVSLLAMPASAAEVQADPDGDVQTMSVVDEEDGEEDPGLFGESGTGEGVGEVTENTEDTEVAGEINPEPDDTEGGTEDPYESEKTGEDPDALTDSVPGEENQDTDEVPNEEAETDADEDTETEGEADIDENTDRDEGENAEADEDATADEGAEAGEDNEEEEAEEGAETDGDAEAGEEEEDNEIALFATTKASGECGTGVTWVLTSDGKLTISSVITTGMSDWSHASDVPWYSYMDSIKTIVIEEGVTNIGDGAFYGCSNLTKVTIPSTVTYIGASAFRNCTSLTSITIPSGVTKIKNYAFYGCSNLTSVSLPSSITEIGHSVFYECISLTDITIPSKVTSIESEMFWGCTSLSSVTLPSGLTKIGTWAFYNCSSLIVIAIPSKVTSIEDYAFKYCTALKNVSYDGSKTQWGKISIGSDNTCLTGATITYNTSLKTVSLTSLELVSGGVKLTWPADSNAAGYYVYRSTTGKSGSWTKLTTIKKNSTTTYTDTPPKNGTLYYYCVRSYTDINDDSTRSDYVVSSITYYASTVKTVSNPTMEDGTYNLGKQDYSLHNYSSTMSSYLVKVDSGYMRVEYTGSQIAVEYYDKNYNLTSKKYITCELSMFGGFYVGSNAYYLVFGESNPTEDSSAEVIRVVKYSTSWKRQGQASVYGANTYKPFEAGSCRMEESDGYLYIRTCHQMYADSSGKHHQANMTIVVNESTMTATVCDTAYVSHSFNQFVLEDDSGNLLFLDHGDSGPRALVLYKISGSGSSISISDSIKLMTFQGSSGENYTGASVGGFEYSSSSYLVAGSSVKQNSSWSSNSTRNIFVSVTSRSNFSDSGTSIKWITSYSEGGSSSASTPQLVKLGSNSFLLMWMANSKLNYVFLDGKGNTTSSIYKVDGAMSDCQPIVSGGKVIWYVTDFSTPVFYSIDSSGKFTSTSTSAGNTDIVKINGVWTYTVNGTADYSYTGLAKNSNGWYYIKNGKLDRSYTGFATNSNGKWYVESGKVTKKTNGVFKDSKGVLGSKSSWYYVVGSKVQTSFTGLANYKNASGWWYITKGKVDRSYKGLAKNNNGWFYLTNGKVDRSYTGFATNSKGKWYVEKGKVTKKTNGVFKDSKGVLGSKSSWYYVVGSKVQTSFTGLANYSNASGWWYITKGKVDRSYNGLAKNKNGWFYLKNGKVDRSYTGLAKNENGWWYIKKGKLDRSYTGLAKNSNGTWYVKNGKVQKSYTGTVTVSGTKYSVTNGKVKV